ncbi:glycine zipper 2TM domain-containing protein [Amaricoccus macauensis]|uniref:glycine zipper 2TM domain-containing protein n=1 Tax=Amaricoccus macauensis TaxID=57001 RepID=UPI003C7E8D19
MKRTIAALGLVIVGAAACTNNPQTNRDIECGAGVLGGAAVGGILGNQIGGGTGQDIATAVGAGAGAAAGTRLPACQ